MINLMVACAENRVMGRKDRLPWRIPEDLRIFHEETAGKTIILGRICYQTWPRALEDGRRLIVVSSDPSLERENVRVVRSVPQALEVAHAVPVAVGEGPQVHLVQHAVVPPRARLIVHRDLPGRTDRLSSA